MMWQLQLVHLVQQQQPVKSASSSIKQSSSSKLNSSSSKLNSTSSSKISSSSNLCSRKQELGKPGPPRRERLPSHPVPLLYLALGLNRMPHSHLTTVIFRNWPVLMTARGRPVNLP